MAIGPGKYDDACTLVRTMLGARGVLLVVLDGIHGNGFACQTDPEVLARLPELLDQLSADLRQTRDHDLSMPTFRIERDRRDHQCITCQLCEARSYHPNDILNRYCGRCHLHHGLVAEGRRGVAAGGSHECDEWRTARDFCALCGATLGPRPAV
jgi:hypothetical protein